ncbi:MAG TPA: protein kinase [Kofleriaceae bacterium]
MKGSNESFWRRSPAGAHLGRYRLIAEIARGGIGTVYVAWGDGPTGFRKLVAIKALRADLPAESALGDMLAEEARVASRLHHPHIAQLYDRGDDGGPFLVMEYVHGESLAAVLAAAGALPARIGVWIAANVCDALAYVHALRDERGAELGLVHRDVSPQNILIDYEGVPRLLDFGIARARHRVSDTEQGVVKGRFAYMAPEQRAGGRIDGRVDLHALGIVLYQATVGVHPWEFENTATDRIPDPRPHRPGFSDALWGVIERATAADPERRFPTAGEMLAALREVASGLGPSVDRGEVATLLDGLFRERRAAKQRLLGGETIDGDTEALAPTAAGRSRRMPSSQPPTIAVSSATDPPIALDARALVPGERAANRRPKYLETPGPPGIVRRSWVRWVALLLLAGVALGGGWLWRSAAEQTSTPAVAVAGILQQPCLLAEPSGTLADRDAAWLAVRLVGLALDRHPRLQPRHGYRIQDREGWNPAGHVAAERACAAAGAGVVLVIAAPGGRPRAIRHGQLVGEQTARGLAGAAALAEQLAAALAPAPAGARPWRASLPDWPDRFLRPLLEVREGLVLQRPYVSPGRDLEAQIRNNPQLEFASLADVISRWWSGDLDDPPERAKLSARSGTSPRAEVLVGAIIDLAAGDEAGADAAVAGLLEDPRWAADPLTLYIAGEARLHSGRPAEGARLLERALDADPQLTPAIYHVANRRLAEGDWAGVERMAVLWDRVEPGSTHALELRGAVLLGAGRYAEASRIFESLFDRSRSDTAVLDSSPAALIYARLLAGDTAGALARASVVSDRLGPALTAAAVLPDPIGYAWALGRGDPALAGKWEEELKQRRKDKEATANYWQLAYSLAILDHLAGRTGGRARWVDRGPSASVPRRYRFAAHERMLAVLEARTGDRSALEAAAREDRDLPAFHLARAFLAARDHRTTDEVDELDAAMASSANGDFDCVAAALLVGVQTAAGDTTGAAATCQRILVPRVPRPYCLIARRDCAAPPPNLPPTTYFSLRRFGMSQ